MSPSERVSGAEIRTTHMTGNATDLGIELGKLVYWNDASHTSEKVVANREKLGIHAGLIASFVAGGCLGALGFRRLGYGVTIPLAVLLLVIAVGASVAASNTYSSQNGGGIEVAGVVISAVGLAGVIPGVLMIAGNARTKETQQTGTASRTQASAPTRAVWGDEAKNTHGPAMPAVPSIALFSGSF